MKKFNIYTRNWLPILLIPVILPVTSRAQLLNKTLASLEKEMVTLVEIVKPCVVTIYSKTTISYSKPKEKSFFDVFNREEIQETIHHTNVGSGLVYTKSGYIITKKSVVLGSDSLMVQFSNCMLVPAQYIGVDSRTGLALLKADAGNIITPKFGSSENIKVGSWITVVGNSMGVSPSVSFGMINGIRDDGLLQLAVNVSPGNTGSPVFDMQGRVVGILSARVILNNDFIDPYNWEQSISSVLAYPVDSINKVVNRILNHNSEQVGWIGVTTNRMTCNKGIAVIEAIATKGPADNAGLKAGDIILGIRDFYLSNQYDLIESIRDTPAGETIHITFQRDDRVESCSLVVGLQPDDNDLNNLQYKLTNGKIISYAELNNLKTSLVESDNVNLDSERIIRRINIMEKELHQLRNLLNRRY